MRFSAWDHLRHSEARGGKPKLKAYWDRKQYSIGFGTKSHKGEVITPKEAERRMRAAVKVFEDCVNRYVKVPLEQHQFDALVSFSYNVGCGAFKRSTLLRKLNAGDYDEVPHELMRWRKPRSILKRRRKEVALWNGTSRRKAAFSLGRRMNKLAVVIGHNSREQGAVGQFGPLKRVSEYRYNTDVAKEMERLGYEYGLDIKTFRRHAPYPYWKEIDVAYGEADKWGANCSVELHFNGSSSSRARYTITLSSGTRQSLALSERLQDAMVHVFGRTASQDKGIITRTRGRGSRSLVAGKAPAALVEPFFGSNKKDCELAMDVGHEAYARALLQAVADYLGTAPRTSLLGSRTMWAQGLTTAGTVGDGAAGSVLYANSSIPEPEGGALGMVGDAMQSIAGVLEPIAALMPWVILGSTGLLITGIGLTTWARISDFMKGKR